MFLAGQAYADDWTPAHLRSAVRRGDIDRLWRGAYATPVPPTAVGRSVRLVQRSVAACLSGFDVSVSHLAAAGLRGWPWWAAEPRPCVTTWSPALSVLGDVHVHRSPLPYGDAVNSTVGPVTSAGRTIVDITREFGLESGLVTADAALRSGGVKHDELVAALDRAGGLPGVRRARDLLELVEPLSESVLESRSRYRIHLAGLPPPRCQAVLLDTSGAFIARVDFLWEEFGVVGEADGLDKYERDPRRQASEGRRAAALDRVGLGYESWLWADLDRFGTVARRLENAFALAQSRPRARRWRVAESVHA